MRLLRRLAERLTNPLVFRRWLPAPFHVPLYVTPAAGLKFLFKPMAAADPPLLRCAETLVRAGDVVWDIGANIGLFAFAAAARAGAKGRVIAFEPDDVTANLLRRSAAIQPFSSAPVTVVNAAVAATVGERDFSIAARSRASSALSDYGLSQMGGVTETRSVQAFNLDFLLSRQPSPQVLKIDVEGAEVEVLDRQRGMLGNARPLIICEVSQGNASRITDILTSAGYRLYDGDEVLQRDRNTARAAWNTVAVPQEKLDRLPA